MIEHIGTLLAFYSILLKWLKQPNLMSQMHNNEYIELIGIP